MKYLYLLLFLISTQKIQAEELLQFRLNHCLDSATHIFKGLVKNTDGLIKITQILKGKYEHSSIQFPEFQHLNKNGDYAPENTKDWELIVFLKEDTNGNLNPIKVYRGLIERSFQLALSILWVKKGIIYFSIQPTNPGPVIFGKRSTLKEMEPYIISYINVQAQIDHISKKKKCKRQIRQLKKLYSKPIHEHLAYHAIIHSSCRKNVLNFLEKEIKKGTYNYKQRRALEDFIKLNPEEKKVNRLFEKEFTFWKKYTAKTNEKWWKYKSSQGKRYVFFKSLMSSIVINKTGNWEEKCNRVVQHFSQLEDYNTAEKVEKLHEVLTKHYLIKK